MTSAKNTISPLIHDATPRLRTRPDNIAVEKDGSLTIFMPPEIYVCNQGVVVFEKVLRLLDWSIYQKRVIIDLSRTNNIDSAALSMLVLYATYLQFRNSCGVNINLPPDRDGKKSNVTRIWENSGAGYWYNATRKPNGRIAYNQTRPLLSVKEYDDFDDILEKFSTYINGVHQSYIDTLRYIISELIYNAIEHGTAFTSPASGMKQIPALISFHHNKNARELHLSVIDLGIGIKKHLEQFIPGFENDSQAILKSLEPKISGTFGNTDPYKGRNNAGFGLYLSSGLAKDLRGDMYIVSRQGRVHISPQDVTTRDMSFDWPGTIVYVKIKLNRAKLVSVEETMSKIRQNAREEISRRNETTESQHIYFSMRNYFGEYAENKSEAITFRNNHLLPAINAGKSVKLDFSEVRASPHSFLNALLADAINILGDLAYRRIRIVNAGSEIRDTIDYVIEDNLP